VIALLGVRCAAHLEARLRLADGIRKTDQRGFRTPEKSR